MNEHGDPQLTPDEEAWFDRRVDEGVDTPADALREIMERRQLNAPRIGAIATGEITLPQSEEGESRKYSRRPRGRSYPERHDWDEVPEPYVPKTPEQLETLDTGVNDLEAIGIAARADLGRKRGLSEALIAARERARQDRRHGELSA